ncbi:MAG: sigma-54-dependent transcriptional regulator [Rectinemataceae bacterium]
MRAHSIAHIPASVWSGTALRVLLVDEDAGFLDATTRRLGSGSLAARLVLSRASSGVEALARLESRTIDLVLCDLHLPDLEGRPFLEKITSSWPSLGLIIVAGDEDIRSALECLHHGAWDYLLKPLDFVELELRITRFMEEFGRRAELESLRGIHPGKGQGRGWELRLPSQGMQEVRRSIEAIKGSDFPVLILGESGTGKELIVDALHRLSPRAAGPLVKVNSAGLVASLLESEMFGHEKGSFTGAISAKAGKFELAGGGTLFLDEIGDLEMSLQAKLLRVLQDGSYERVGGTRTRRADVRVIAATNHDLALEVHAGRFREDLYYRLNVIRIDVPPLRERREDILVLAMRFLVAFSRRYSRSFEGFSPEAATLLEAYGYPGNVRELENAVARAFTLSRGPLIQAGDLPAEIRREGTALKAVSVPQTLPLSSNLASFLALHEEAHLREVLGRAGDNRSLAAEWLGISRRQFYNKLERYRIEK